MGVRVRGKATARPDQVGDPNPSCKDLVSAGDRNSPLTLKVHLACQTEWPSLMPEYCRPEGRMLRGRDSAFARGKPHFRADCLAGGGFEQAVSQAETRICRALRARCTLHRALHFAAGRPPFWEALADPPAPRLSQDRRRSYPRRRSLRRRSTDLECARASVGDHARFGLAAV